MLVTAIDARRPLLKATKASAAEQVCSEKRSKDPEWSDPQAAGVPRGLDP